MSQVVDKKVVEMRFDNRQFESGVQTSMSTLEKLKRSLNLDGAAKGLESVNAAAKNCDMSGISKGVETIKARFSALQVAGVTAMANIANSAVNAGKRLVSAFTIEPIKAGFQEYETQMNSVQTILANTQKEHTNVKIVNKALDELNTYADKTIYNFTEMTRNIGTFTAAGVKLKPSVSAIKGIANLAAVSGSTSQQASVAMYQLSQALASGTVKLQDWNSVVNAGMGGKVFQDALIRTSEHLKTGAKSAIKAKGSFRESLKEGWLTTKVLTQTLDQFSTAADTEKEYEAAVKKFVKQGYSKKQAKQMADMAKTAGEAATKVKTFTQLIDTLKEAAGSGWTTTWRLIIGDFEEAKGLWTNVSDKLGDMINKSSEARNNMVKGWAKGGGRDALIDSVSNAFEGLLSVIKPIKEAFKDIFPPITSKQLIAFTQNLKDLTSKMKLSEERADKLKRIFKGVFAIFDIGKKAIMAIIKPFFELSQSKGFNSFADSLLETFASVGDVLTSWDKSLDFSSISDILSSIASVFSKTFSGISKAIDLSSTSFGSFKDTISSFGKWISNAFSKVSSVLKPIFSWLGDGLSTAFSWVKDNVSLGDVFSGLLTGGLLAGISKFTGLLDKLGDVIDKIFGNKGTNEESIGTKFKNILDQVHESLAAFTTGIRTSSLVSIAAAIGLLSISLSSISNLDADELAKGIIGIGSLFVILGTAFKSFNKSLTPLGSKGIIKSGIAMVGMAVAIKVLSKALVTIAKIKIDDIIKGLFSIGVALFEFSVVIKKIGDANVSIKTIFSMILIAESCKILGKALATIGKLSWDEVARGLVGMGGALAEVSVVTSILGKFGKGKSIIGAISMIIMVQSLDEISKALKSIGSLSLDKIKRGLTGMGIALAELGTIAAVLGKFGGMGSIAGAISVILMTKTLKPISDILSQIGSLSWDEIKIGLTGMGVALIELGVVAGLLGKLTKTSGIIGAVSILIMVQALKPISDALAQIGSLSWDKIKIGLTGMGVALIELGVVAGLLGKLTKISGIVGATSILIMAQALQPISDALSKIGSLSWGEIVRGLAGMGVALTELGVVAGLLGKLTGLSGIVGATSILIMVQGLNDLANALVKFGSMTWGEIVRGLVGMGGALTELGVISGLLGNLGGLGATLGAGTILLAVKGLDDLANALKKFGEMPWEEVKNGLAAMGAALGEIALGSLLNTLSGLGAASLSVIAEPLGKLADSVKKWAGVTIPNNLGIQLGLLANGVMAFTLTGSGANSISTVAAPLGVLADSVKKWADVTVPEGIGKQLKQLASGVKKFTFDGMGANALATAAAPVGILADSIKKWSDVTVPEGMKDNLNDISDGIKSFSWAFTGSWSLDKVVGPLGKLPSALKKWADVTVPAGMKDNLKDISDGIKSFNWAFTGSWSLDQLIIALGKLPGVLQKWANVTVPAGIKDNLKDISEGVKSFAWSFTGSWSLDQLAKPFGKLADALKKWTDVDVPEGMKENLKSISEGVKTFSNAKIPKDIGDKIKAISEGIKSFSGIGDISSVSNSIKSIADSSATLSGSKFKAISSGLNTFVSSLKKMSGVTINTKSVTSAISNVSKSMKSSVSSSMKKAMSGIPGVIKNMSSAVKSATISLVSTLTKTISSKKPSVTSAFKSLVSGASGAIKDKRSAMVSAGKYLGSGLIEGITYKQPAVYKAAFKLGQTAVEGEKKGQKSNSPSKLTIQAGHWFGEGLVIGIEKMGSKVYSAGYNAGDTAVKAMSGAISRISDIVNGDIDAQPTIRPVVDLSNVRSSAGTINSLFGATQSISTSANISAINSMMNKRNQNDANSDIIDAINKLRKDVSNIEANSYNFGDITYDDGSGISDAVRTLINAAKIERRM